MAGFDVNAIKGNDRIIVGGGLLVFIASFFPWYGYGASSGVFHFSVKGWSVGGSAVIGILLCLAATVFVVLRASGQLNDVSLPVGPALLVLGLSGLAVIFFLIRWVSLPSGGGAGFSYGPRIGLFLGLAALVMPVFAALSFRESGESLPGQGSTNPPPAP